MPRAQENCTIVYLKQYEKDAKGVLGHDEEQWIAGVLARNPEVGPVMRETGGFRKLRVALPGRGKSGGARVVYYYRGLKGLIYMITVFAKNDKENISKSERSELKKLAAYLEEL